MISRPSRRVSRCTYAVRSASRLSKYRYSVAREQLGQRHPALHPGRGRTQAVVGAVAEGQDVARAPSDIEFARVRAVLAFVAVGRAVRQQNLAASWDGGVADRDIARGRACQTLHRRGEPQQFLDRVRDARRVIQQQPALVGPPVQQRHRTTEHAGDGVVAAGDHGERERQYGQCAGGVAVGADPGGYQVGDGVVGGLGAASLDQPGEVGHHRADRVQCAGDAAVNRVRRHDGLGPAVELRPILFGNTEIVRHHHRRERFE